MVSARLLYFPIRTTTVNKEEVLSIDDMLAADDVKYAEVSAWGGKVRLGSLDAGSMLDFVEANEGSAKRTAGIRLLVKSLVDKDGKRIGEDRHVDLFKKKDAGTINRMLEEIMRLNGLDDKKAATAKNDSSEAV